MPFLALATDGLVGTYWVEEKESDALRSCAERLQKDWKVPEGDEMVINSVELPDEYSHFVINGLKLIVDDKPYDKPFKSYKGKIVDFTNGGLDALIAMRMED